MTSKIRVLDTGKSFDDLDVRILEPLRTDARVPLSELARRLSLSQPAVSQRVRKLEEAGVIRG